MQQISIIETKLTYLQENILIELNKTANAPFICKKFNIKPITLSKAIQSLVDKNMITDGVLTERGKKMVHYLEFRNETISLFLKKQRILITDELTKQMCALDYKIIIALRNLL